MCSAPKLLNPAQMLPGGRNKFVNPGSVVTSSSNRLINPVGSSLLTDKTGTDSGLLPGGGRRVNGEVTQGTTLLGS